MGYRELGKRKTDIGRDQANSTGKLETEAEQILRLAKAGCASNPPCRYHVELATQRITGRSTN